MTIHFKNRFYKYDYLTHLDCQLKYYLKGAIRKLDLELYSSYTLILHVQKAHNI